MASDVIVGDLIDAGAAEIVTGPFGTQLKASEYVDDGWPVINVRNVGFGDIRSSDVEYVTDEKADQLARHRLQPGDIVFGRKGAVERHALIRPPQTGWVQGSDCIRLRLDRNLYRPDFASLALRTPWHQQWMKNLCSFGATMASLNQDIVRLIALPGLSLGQQDAVIGQLSAFDDLIENNRRRIRILEEMARLLYREWFVHFRFPGHEDVGLVDSELGPIPEGWKVRTLSDFCEHKKRNLTPHKFEGEQFLHYSIPALDTDRLPSLELGETIRSGKYELVKDCVLLSKLNPRFPRVWRSQGPYPHRAVCSTEFLVLESSPEGWPLDYLQCFVQNSDLGSRLAQMAGGTSTSHQRVKPGDVMALPIIAPVDELVNALSEQLQPTNELVLNLVDQNRVLREARDLLLPRLVSGELDVSELDLAEVLG